MSKSLIIDKLALVKDIAKVNAQASKGMQEVSMMVVQQGEMKELKAWYTKTLRKQ